MASLTDEQHQARAMLMGMEYTNPPNALPVYFKRRADGSMDIGSMIHADTMVSIFEGDISGRKRYRTVRAAVHSEKGYF